MTFKEFLAEMEGDLDTEDLGPDELKQKARGMLQQARMKAAGQEERAAALNIKALRTRAKEAKDPRTRADLQRRVGELMRGDKEEENAAI